MNASLTFTSAPRAPRDLSPPPDSSPGVPRYVSRDDVKVVQADRGKDSDFAKAYWTKKKAALSFSPSGGGLAGGRSRSAVLPIASDT